MSVAKSIPIAFVPGRVALEWPDAAAMIGMTARQSGSAAKARQALYTRFYRWSRRRGILPDECGLFSVRKIEQAVAA